MSRGAGAVGRPAGSEIIAGVHAVDEAVMAGERIHRIALTSARTADSRIKDLIARAKARGIAVEFESEPWFARLAPHHQHIAAIVDAFAYASFESVRGLARTHQDVMLVAIDHVEDPQNIGAIVRNAEGAGVGATILPDRRSASLSSAARRAAAGAASHMKITRVPNLVRALEDLKEVGCWVTGLALTRSAVSYLDADLTGKRVFVVGSEGKGLHRLVSERCDQLVQIPLLGKVSSLNAASATACRSR